MNIFHRKPRSAGPIAGALSNALGCRTVAIFGSLLAAAGLGIARYAGDMQTMCLFAGAITGIGYGFIFLPAACTISFYFEKRRAFATGIAVCGSGIGGLFLGMFVLFESLISLIIFPLQLSI